MSEKNFHGILVGHRKQITQSRDITRQENGVHNLTVAKTSRLAHYFVPSFVKPEMNIDLTAIFLIHCLSYKKQSV
jgi:hypothetical protein